MSDELSRSPDLADLEKDLTLSFQPAWTKQNAPVPKRHFEDAPEREDRRDRRDKPRGPRKPFQKGRPDRSERREEPRRPAPLPSLAGWTVAILPDEGGMTGLARQIRTTAKAYSLFDLAHLVLERPERFRVEFKRNPDGPALYQLESDGSLWLGEREAIAHALSKLSDRFYRRDQEAVEPPKGAYSFVGVCGLSGAIIGPPNHHDYQPRLRKLHAEKFSNMSFDDYKGRIRMERGEEFLQKWRDEMSTREVFFPLDTPEGAEPVKLSGNDEIERHFRQHHASQIIPVMDQTIVPGAVAIRGSDQMVSRLVRSAWEQLKRFPLPVAHVVGKSLNSAGLQIFKAHENITYASVARPRYLDRSSSPVAEPVSAILEYLENNPRLSRADQWKSLLALRPVPEGRTEAERDAAVAGDLSWLIHQGHVVDYSRGNLEAVRRPAPRDPADKKK